MSSTQTTPSETLLSRQWQAVRNWRKPQFWCVVIALAYTLLGFFALPQWLESTIESVFADVGRSASVAEIRFNPYSLQLEIDGLKVLDTDQTKLMGFDGLRVNAQTSSLFRWAATFREISLTGLELDEERFEDGSTRLTNLFEDLAPAAEEAAPEQPPAALPRLVVHYLAINGAHMGFTDQLAGGFATRFGPIDAHIDDLRTLPDHSGAQSVQINTADGGMIRWQGTLETVPLRSVGELTIEGEGLKDGMRYAEHFLSFQVLGDSTSVQLNYVFEWGAAGPQLDITDLQAQTLGLKVIPDGVDEPILETESIRISNASMHWPEQTFAADQLDISGFGANLELTAQGELNLLSLVPEAQSVTPQAPGSQSKPWAVNLQQFTLTGKRVNLKDSTIRPALEVALEDLQVTLSDLDLLDGTVMPARGSLSLSSGGDIRFDGGVTAFPAPAASGALSIQNLQLKAGQPYVETIARVGIESGTLDLNADLEHHPGQPLALSGEMTVRDFEAANLLLKERLTGWKQLRLDRFEVDLAKAQVVSSVLELDQPYGRVHIAEDLSTNISGLLVEAPDGTNDAASSQPLDITIGGLQFADASLDFSDFSLPLPFEAAIRSMDGTISTLATSSTEPATVDMEGQVNEFGLARINGVINAWDPTALTDIEMVFRNLELSRMSPYTVQFAGYEIDAGRMDLDLEYSLNQRQLKGDNSVIIRDIQLGEKLEHEGAGSLPLGLAVALLTDSEGVIDVALPVEGNLDDPQFKIGGVVMRALGNLIAKVVTAPFRFLAGLVGADSEDFGQLEFQPGSAEVSPPDREKLLKLSQAMAQRPVLTLEVAGIYDERLDRRALQQQALDQALSAWLDTNPGSGEELSTDRDRRSLEALFSEQLPDQPSSDVAARFTTAATETEPEYFDETAYLAELRDTLVAVQTVTSGQLTALAQQRAQAVAQTLNAAAEKPEGTDSGTLNVHMAEVQVADGDDNQAIVMELSVSAAATEEAKTIPDP